MNTDKMSYRYLSNVETAGLIRQRLKNEFPGVKFSVRSDTCSILVRWKDGPALGSVKAVAESYESRGFDGSIDLCFSKFHWLYPDGTVSLAKSHGSARSGGSMEPGTWEPVKEDAELVCLGDCYIHCERTHSREFLEYVGAIFTQKWGEPAPAIVESFQPGTFHYKWENCYTPLESQMTRLLRETSAPTV